MKNDSSYMAESPEVTRKANGKAGVMLAPLNAMNGPPTVGRSSMMSNEHSKLTGSDSHPILRVQNFKKPTLDKIQNS